MADNHKTLSSRSVFRGRIFEVFVDEVELPGGERAQREIVRHPGAVAVVAAEVDGSVLLVEQARHAVGETSFRGGADEGETIPLVRLSLPEVEALVSDGRVSLSG